MDDRFDVVVVGAGHAGCEAALAAARLGCDVALVTLRLSMIAELSCNPAIGGLAKGQLVREIDALGGEMARVADAAGIQFRLLNRSRGPAVQAPRAQADKDIYKDQMRRRLEAQERLRLVEGKVEEILTSSGRVGGVRLADGTTLAARAVVVTTGTFLRGLMHTGQQQTRGGRVDEEASDGLSASLASLGLTLGRLKTGTPARLDGTTIDYARLKAQPADEQPQPFSFDTESIDQPQICCHLTRTNPVIHELIRANTHRAPLFTGQIQSVGPRYCPSIEDKVVRFPDKESHQVFLEPEYLHGRSVYPNGISTSLPAEVQDEIVRNLPGCEQARIIRYGYAVEYDFVPARQCRSSLEARAVAGLFLAGQVLGTSGYEEAAGQGLVAGVNAARLLAGRAPWVPGRTNSYLGVMVDDLVTKDIREPYRLFTSRSEYRLLLRHDNAPYRLAEDAQDIGLAPAQRLERFRREARRIDEALELLAANQHQGRTWAAYLCRPHTSIHDVTAQLPPLASLALSPREAEQAETAARYQGYVKRLRAQLARMEHVESVRIPPQFDFCGLKGLKREAAEALARFQPETLGQASRLAGITPADVQVLEVYLRR